MIDKILLVTVVQVVPVKPFLQVHWPVEASHAVPSEPVGSQPQVASHFVPLYPALQVHWPVESAHCKLLEPVASQPQAENKMY